MATRFYFHNALSTVVGTLPSDEQSSLTPNNTPSTNPEARTINRSMNTTKGTSEVTKTCLSNATVSSQNYYFTRFVSPPLDVTSITAQTWTYSISTKQGNNNANFPVKDTNKSARVNVYVWRPSTGAKVGTVLDGSTAANVLEASATNQFSDVTTFSGALVSSMLTGDVLISELWAAGVTQDAASAYNNNFYYDGTVIPTDDAQETDVACYLETPQNITFPPAIVAMTNVSTKTLTDKFITKV